MSSAPVYASSNVLMQPSPNPTGKQVNYPRMKIKSIRAFSIIAIILGVESIGLQIAALVIWATEAYYCVYFDIDYVGHGIWAGVFYIIAGSLGMAATYRRTKSLLIGTVVMAAIAIASSIVASVLSGMAAGYGYYSWYDDICQAWYGLEWTLFSISVLAFTNSIILTILPSLALCSKQRTNNAQLPYAYELNGQMVLVQPQQMQQAPYPYAYVNNMQPQQPAPVQQMQQVVQQTAPNVMQVSSETKPTAPISGAPKTA